MSIYKIKSENDELHVEEVCKLSGIRFDHIEVVGGLLYFQTKNTLHYYDTERCQIVVVAAEVQRFFKTSLDGTEVVLTQSTEGKVRALDTYCDIVAEFDVPEPIECVAGSAFAAGGSIYRIIRNRAIALPCETPGRIIALSPDFVVCESSREDRGSVAVSCGEI